MPWKSGQEFATKHNHALHGKSADKAASIANAVLRESGDEGKAIRIANARARADGGYAREQIEPGNIDLGARPVVRNADGTISTVRSMSFGTDRGEVLVPTVSDDGRILSEDGARDQYFKTGKHLGIFSTPDEATGYAQWLHGQQESAYAPRADGGSAAIENAIRIAKRAVGGYTPPSPSYAERGAIREVAEAHPYGFTAGTGPGRLDKNDVSVGSGSYVLPADVVAGLGDGNSLAGAHVWNMMLQSMPYGVTPPKIAGRHPPPSPPHDASLMQGITGSGAGTTRQETTQPHFADGGDAPEVPIKSADGEIIISPEDVLRVGMHYAPEREHGDRKALMRRGHRVLDGFVKGIRGNTIRHLKKLKGPVGSKNASKGHV